MEEENLPAQVKMLSKSALLGRIPILRAAVQSGAELNRLERAHTIQLMMLWESHLTDELDELQNLIDLVSKQKFQSVAFRTALLWDLRGYANSTAGDCRKIKDRVFKALQGAPPTDPKADDLEAVQLVSGHEVHQPARFKK